MSQILDSLPKIQSQRLVCLYRNSSDLIQIARIANIPHWYFERVVFPQESLCFEATPEGILEVYQADEDQRVQLIAEIACDRLGITEPEPIMR